MRIALDTSRWQEIDAETVVWAGPWENHWTPQDADKLLSATPPGSLIGVWKIREEPESAGRLDRVQRSFRWDHGLRRNILYSRDLKVDARTIWFDFASVDSRCGEDLARTIQQELGWNAGIVVLPDSSELQRSMDLVSQFVENVASRARPSEPEHDEFETWMHSERVRLIREVPGYIVGVTDSNGTRYLLGTSPLAIEWLTSAGRETLDLHSVWAIGVSVEDPRPAL
jgi:hypothetical protein